MGPPTSRLWWEEASRVRSVSKIPLLFAEWGVKRAGRTQLPRAPLACEQLPKWLIHLTAGLHLALQKRQPRAILLPTSHTLLQTLPALDPARLAAVATETGGGLVFSPPARASGSGTSAPITRRSQSELVASMLPICSPAEGIRHMGEVNGERFPTVRLPPCPSPPALPAGKSALLRCLAGD